VEEGKHGLENQKTENQKTENLNIENQESSINLLPLSAEFK
jgi:hypothetical protein